MILKKPPHGGFFVSRETRITMNWMPLIVSRETSFGVTSWTQVVSRETSLTCFRCVSRETYSHCDYYLPRMPVSRETILLLKNFCLFEKNTQVFCKTLLKKIKLCCIIIIVKVLKLSEV